MRIECFFLILILLVQCKDKDLVELKILNNRISLNDSLRIKFKNNSKNNYLIYLDNLQPDYSDKPHRFNVNFMYENKIVQSEYPISDPLWILNEDGSLDKEDRLQQKIYFDCISKDRGRFLKLPAKETINFNIPLIDSIDECGRENYPILEKNKLYKISLKIILDSNLIGEKSLKEISILQKEKKFKIFQGKLQSNTVKFKY